MFRLFSLVFLLVISVCSQEWKIQYLNTAKCALKGSSILLSSTYEHPARFTVTEIFWTVNPVKGEENINLFNHPDYKGRVQYFGKEESFNLKLNIVTRKDEGIYCLRIVTNVENQRYLGYPGVELKVTELRVEVPEEVVEKHSAVLFCNTTCNLGNKNFTWYKNGKPISETNVNQLFLPSVSSEDAGKYSCALRDQKHLPSSAVILNVRYPPRSVSVSVSGSSEVLEGDSVRLICSSDSNPPALTFSWFQENHTSAVGSGQSFSISSFNSSLSGRFYCEAHNKYGSQRSHAVTLTLAGGQRTALYAAAAFGAVFICICIIIVLVKIMRRKKQNAEVRGGVSKQDSSSVAVTDQTSSYESKPAVQNDVMYISVVHRRPEERQSAGDQDEVQYACVQHLRNTERTREKAKPQHSHDPAESERGDVIYSSINTA